MGTYEADILSFVWKKLRSLRKILSIIVVSWFSLPVLPFVLNKYYHIMQLFHFTKGLLLLYLSAKTFWMPLPRPCSYLDKWIEFFLCLGIQLYIYIYIYMRYICSTIWLSKHMCTPLEEYTLVQQRTPLVIQMVPYLDSFLIIAWGASWLSCHHF